jgi:hypothetical protein
MTFIESFAAAMLGHFVGDYLFQNQWMALNKTAKGLLGHLACTVHVLLYTFAIALFVGWHPLFLLVVAVPHWIIDRWSLASYWLTFKNGIAATELWDIKPLTPITTDGLQRNVWKLAFAAPVYIFNDNTIHWVCLWFTCKYFF